MGTWLTVRWLGLVVVLLASCGGGDGGSGADGGGGEADATPACLHSCPPGYGCDETDVCVPQTHLQVIVRSYVDADDVLSGVVATDALLWRGQTPNSNTATPPIPEYTAGRCSTYYAVALDAPSGFDEACLDSGTITASTDTNSTSSSQEPCKEDGYFDIAEFDDGALANVGSVQLSSLGGADVGWFDDKQVRFPQPINAVFDDPTSGVPMPISWTARGPGNVVIAGHSSGEFVFRCVVPANDGGVTVPRTITDWVHGGYSTLITLENTVKVLTSNGAFVEVTAKREEYFYTFY